MEANGAKTHVSIAEYKKISGLSYPTIKNALDKGQLKGVLTEAGHWRVDTRGGDGGDREIMARLERQERLLEALCGHLGVHLPATPAAWPPMKRP